MEETAGKGGSSQRVRDDRDEWDENSHGLSWWFMVVIGWHTTVIWVVWSRREMLNGGWHSEMGVRGGCIGLLMVELYDYGRLVMLGGWESDDLEAMMNWLLG
ncbi:unnamed protein product [Sphenostylis stenocarpa]|uniref:Transmembrane protein n=1 Tax=Sphenostylis stenocarpa TaxID=92480 RepID=A0AA86V9I6_9FABA|nr:unnamed protein product [Sphenostylis stenocarpa]